MLTIFKTRAIGPSDFAATPKKQASPTPRHDHPLAINGKTPWVPSRSACERVKDKLPVPTECPHCRSSVDIVHNSEIYGRAYGEWPWAYQCCCCEAYVGMHPFTNLPLGTLATAEMRHARKAAKAYFNKLHEGYNATMDRSEAYAWLAAQLGMPVSQCHFGLFDVDMANRAGQICIEYLAQNKQRRPRAVREPQPQMLPRVCANAACGTPFLARAADVKRGWGQYCCKACAKA